ncbi:DNA polymerase III [Azospirillum sp.]|uniref:DNA polymerase III n=1 Tax=Azospirillum sp. TaxID=34012 RepID=UPI003D71FAEF
MIARLRGQQLSAPAYDFLLSEEDSGEAVAIACEATSYDPAKAELRALAAVRIRGNRILASRHVAATFRPGEPPEPALDRFLHLIGNRPLVGYYLDFTVGLIDRAVQPMIGIPLPNERVEVSSLYYESRLKVPGKNALNLRLDAILGALDLPERAGDDAYSNAIAAAMVYLRLKAEE